MERSKTLENTRYHIDIRLQFYRCECNRCNFIEIVGETIMGIFKIRIK